MQHNWCNMYDIRDLDKEIFDIYT